LDLSLFAEAILSDCAQRSLNNGRDIQSLLHPYRSSKHEKGKAGD